MLESRTWSGWSRRARTVARWTTTELLRVEQTALGLARDLTAVPDRDVPPDSWRSAMSGRTLSAEQHAMVERLAAADGLAVVVGPAGAGKTAALAAAATAGPGKDGRSPEPQWPRSPPAASSTPPASRPPP